MCRDFLISAQIAGALRHFSKTQIENIQADVDKKYNVLIRQAEMEFS
jgi:hypothetical protein